MTRDEADKIFGPVVFSDPEYELRAKVEEDGLHVFAFRVEDGTTYTPRGFILGSNSMWYKRKYAK